MKCPCEKTPHLTKNLNVETELRYVPLVLAACY